MGTGSSTDHQTYTVAPTVPAPAATDVVVVGLVGPGDAASTATAMVAPAIPDPQVASVADAGSDSALAASNEDHVDGTVVEEAVTDGLVDGPDGPVADGPGNGDVLVDDDVVDGDALAGDVGVDALTPVPDILPAGLATGTPVLAGGADVTDSTITLTAYLDGDDTREVLFTTVSEQAEAKLLDALGVSQSVLVPTVVQQQINGRLPADVKATVYEKLLRAAKSVNLRLASGEPIPAHVHDYVTAAEAAVAEVTAAAGTADEEAMAAAYQAHLAEIKARLDGSVTAPFTAGGKIPDVTAHLHHGLASVTVLQPVAVEPPDGKLAATEGTATRIRPTLDPDTGLASWNGTDRSAAQGLEYTIDLGDGYTARYRPYTGNDPKTTHFSLRGKLEVIAPPGAGHGSELITRMGQLNLVNRPLTAAEGEWTYLTTNIHAQNLATNPGVAQALAQCASVQDVALQQAFFDNAHHAVGLDSAGLATLAQRLQLDAATRALPMQVGLVRDAVAKATGRADGAALAAHPAYDPVPQRSGGWLTWGRFDVVDNKAAMAAAWQGRRLTHRVGGGGNVVDMLRTGVLASTERRATMGVAGGLGMSEAADKLSGGANTVFLRVGKVVSSPGHATLVWDDPSVLLRRADYFGTNGDHFGAVNPANSHYSAGAIVRDPLKMAGFGASNNEIMFRDGIDLLGAEAPSRIYCGGAPQRQEVLDLLAHRNITHIGGRPVDQVVRA